MMKTHNDGACPACGAVDKLTLAVDQTRYQNCTFKDGKFTAVYGRTEDMDPMGDGHVPVRFFCGACGEYMAVPAELTP